MSCENDKEINSIYKLKKHRIFVSVDKKELWEELLKSLESVTDLRWGSGRIPTDPTNGLGTLRDVLIINLKDRLIYNQYKKVTAKCYVGYKKNIIPEVVFINFIQDGRYDLIATWIGEDEWIKEG